MNNTGTAPPGLRRNKTDYLGIDEETCHFFPYGRYEKAQAAVKKYKDNFPASSPEDFPEKEAKDTK